MHIATNRKQYMATSNDEGAHQAYYGQFDTPCVRRNLTAMFGITRLQDHFAGRVRIPILEWDIAANGLPTEVIRALAESNMSMQAPGSKLSVSSADKTCALKAVARTMVRESADLYLQDTA